MAFIKAKITVAYKDGTEEIIPCFKLLAPFIVNKIWNTQGEDISSCGFVQIEDDEYHRLLHQEKFPIPYATGDIFAQHFWEG